VATATGPFGGAAAKAASKQLSASAGIEGAVSKSSLIIPPSRYFYVTSYA